MYIISDLNGNLIQRSNADIDNLQNLINRFSSELGFEVIGTDDNSLYTKTEETGYFSIIVKDRKIVDVVPKEKPVIEETIKIPTLEERITAIEMAFLEVL